MSVPPLPNLTGGAAGPSNAISPFTGGAGMFDSSGWNVNFGSGSIESSAKKAATDVLGGLQEYAPYALIFVAGMVAWRMSKKG